jgi:hypothetical protein
VTFNEWRDLWNITPLEELRQVGADAFPQFTIWHVRFEVFNAMTMKTMKNRERSR